MKRNNEYVFGMKAAYLAAFAHPMRLQVVEQLRHGERSVGEICRSLGAPQPTVSKHLAILRQQGVVATRPAGVTVYYRLADTAILHVLKLVTAILRKKLEKSQAMLDELSEGLP